MTRDRDIERVLDAWLTPGPTEMPDRVYETVVDRIEGLPQRRWRWAPSRVRPMSPTARLLAAAAAVLVTGGLGFALLGGGSRLGPTTTPIPIPSVATPTVPSPSLRAGVPAELAHSWLGAVRGTASFSAAQDRAVLELTTPAFSFGHGGGNPAMASTAAIDGQNRLVLVSDGNDADCAKGDTGVYAWSLSAEGTKLFIQPGQDACANRGSVVPGAWLRAQCNVTDDLCLGELAAGEYSSAFIEPHLDANGAWKARFGAVTYTVPVGWANGADWPDLYEIMPVDDYRAHKNNEAGPAFAITVLIRPAAAKSNGRDCGMDVNPDAGTNVDALVQSLRANPALTVASPTPITIGGKSGRYVDVTIASTWKAHCPENPRPFSPLLKEFGAAGWGLWERGVGGPWYDKVRLILLDLDSKTLLISITSPTADGFDAFVSRAMPIVQSMKFGD